MFLCNLKDKPLAVATLKEGLYYLDGRTISKNITNIVIKIKHAWTWEEWHCHLGHIAISGLHSLYRKNLIDSFSLHDSPQDFECEACIKAKIERKSVPKMSTPCKRKLGELTHTDILLHGRYLSTKEWPHMILSKGGAHREMQCP